ncbi:MAG: hypothetical protein DDT30_00845 [Dehalococcoidia bacterium]|nr:hypothetical protein [Bacillota bacterium]MBT9143847.1 hypothetical protein [Bacillota bacterium]
MEIFPQGIKVREQLAKLANVSDRTLAKVETIKSEGTEKRDVFSEIKSVVK